METESRKVAFASAFIALGAVSRIVVGNVALESPGPLYGILIKVGLTETLSITNGIACGPTTGFLTGALIIIISDLFMVPGPWTPFIAGIIGLLGFFAGISTRWIKNPNSLTLRVLAVVLTLFSEFLQNAWVTVFYNIPISVTMATGLPSMVTALANNTVLLSTAGPRMIKIIRDTTTNTPSTAS